MSYVAPILPAEATAEVAYGPEAVANTNALLARPFRELFHHLINGYESEAVLPACQIIVAQFQREDALDGLIGPAPPGFERPSALDGLLEARESFRDAVRAVHRELQATALTDKQRTALILLNRSPTALTEPCWLDNVSQPATQPAKVVNDLFRIYAGRLGNGDFSKSAASRFRRLCALHEVSLPPATAIEFARHAGISNFAYLCACYHLALGRHPRLFLPEIIGTTLAHYLLHIDPLSGAFDADAVWNQCREMLRSLSKLCLSSRWPRIEQRVLAGFHVEASLEHFFWTNLGPALQAHGAASPRDRMCALVQRIGRYAGAHHHGVLLQGRPLCDWLNEASADPGPFVDALGASSYFDPANPVNSQFFELLRIDGAMFAIFSKADAKVIKDWAQTLGSGDAARSVTNEDPPLAARSSAAPAFAGVSFLDWMKSTGDAAPPPHRISAPTVGQQGLRELFYRLINVDLNPYILPRAREYVDSVLQRAERDMIDGSAAKYSDATFFDYTPAALEQRVEHVYFHKLLGNYRPIREIPPRPVVVMLQKMLGLGSLIDGAWIHKMGKVPQYGHPAANQLFGIYADEMGYGDMGLNHIMIARRVLDSMDIDLPEMAEREYAYNDSVPEKCFAFLAYQLAISQFPLTLFAEGLGLNLAVEMFGLGQVRLDEVRKLHHYGFDDGYERLHLTIDNVFSGHVKVGLDAIHSYLDEVQLRLGGDGARQAWRRVWLGYASMVQFVE